MHTCEPDLLNILLGSPRRSNERIFHEGLRLDPAVQPKHASSLIDSNGVTEDLDARVSTRVRKRQKLRNQPVASRH
jgi:hypothetical protein